jgi:hypothetical protein
MNTTEQALKKRVKFLESYVKGLEDAVNVLLADLSYTESVGAAFAFDLASQLETDVFHEHSDPAFNAFCDTLRLCEANWRDALGAQRESVDAETPRDE